MMRTIVCVLSIIRHPAFWVPVIFVLGIPHRAVSGDNRQAVIWLEFA
jgi:hypothetical protein